MDGKLEPFRKRAVKLLRAGMVKRKEVADELKLAPGTVGNWTKVEKIDATALRKAYVRRLLRGPHHGGKKHG